MYRHEASGCEYDTSPHSVAPLPAVAEGDVDPQLQVRDPGHGRLPQGPVAGVHDGVLIHQVLRPSAQGTHKAGGGREGGW